MKFIKMFEERYGIELPVSPQPATGTYRQLLDEAKNTAIQERGWSEDYSETICRHGIILKEAYSRLSAEEFMENFYAIHPTFALWRNICQVAVEMHSELGGMEDYIPRA